MSCKGTCIYWFIYSLSSYCATRLLRINSGSFIMCTRTSVYLEGRKDGPTRWPTSCTTNSRSWLFLGKLLDSTLSLPPDSRFPLFSSCCIVKVVTTVFYLWMFKGPSLKGSLKKKKKRNEKGKWRKLLFLFVAKRKLWWARWKHF